MPVTEFARNMKEVLNQVEYKGEEVLLVRNKKKLARLVPENRGATALEVMADLYRTLPETAAESWLADSRQEERVAQPRDPFPDHNRRASVRSRNSLRSRNPTGPTEIRRHSKKETYSENRRGNRLYIWPACG